MNFIDKLLTFFTGANEYYKTRYIGNNITDLSGEPEFIQINNKNAYDLMITTSELYAPIVRRGLMLSCGEWKHEKMNSKGIIEEVIKSPFVNILENPNPLVNGNELIRLYDMNMILYGNNYEFVLKPFKNSSPKILNILETNKIEAKITGKWYKQQDINEIIEYYIYKNGDENEKLTIEQINHTKLNNSNNPILGESPLKSLYMDISNIRASKKFRNVIMTKEGALGFISNNTKDAIGAVAVAPEDRKRMEDAYVKNYGIEDGKSKIFISDANLKWNSTAYPIKDMLLFEEVDAGFKKIIDVLGLDENIFSTASTYENKISSLRNVFQTTIIPLSEELSMNRTKLFGLDGKNEWLRLDYSNVPVLQENILEKTIANKNKSESISTLVGSGMTLQEALNIIEI